MLNVAILFKLLSFDNSFIDILCSMVFFHLMILGVGRIQIPNTSNQIPTSNSGTGTGSGYAVAGCWYGIW